MNLVSSNHFQEQLKQSPAFQRGFVLLAIN
ncbi:hypothetical protein P872_16310 [Rhodonellum psychrophilum GCM71 = DSM 17998]|uniref:Uncharacterized protein n=1 Tax=Rhodonellum psychrophilum GCM71 = DSM 17998 TaxID=1123057 RepID=U5BRM7_9BACT|nr:hypothetical protein P872_16310 [Rhodonellum psychrophilum GCM71 = DSM 17998]